MKRIIFSILLSVSIFANSSGQEVSVNAGFDTSMIFIGDQIRFTVTVDQPAGLGLSISEFNDTIVKNIEILSGPVTDSISNPNGILRIKREYLVTSFDTGRYQVPPVYAELRTEEGLKRFYSDYSYLEVIRPLITPPDTTAKIFDIVAPYKAPLTIGEVLPWALLVLLVAALGYFAFMLYKKYRRADTGHEVIVIPDPAHVIAFRELEKLKEEKLWQKGEVKEYYSRLTTILRQYLENRYNVYSLELTTYETLNALLQTGFKRDGSFDRLKNVLSGADLVKFAKYNPEPTENESFYQDAWTFVMETKPEEQSAVDLVKDDTKAGGKL